MLLKIATTNNAVGDDDDNSDAYETSNDMVMFMEVMRFVIVMIMIPSNDQLMMMIDW